MGSLFKRGVRGGKAGKWYAEFTDASGIRQRKSTGTRDKRAAEQILAAWETEVAKIKAGLADPKADRIRAQQLRPIESHLDEFIESLAAAGSSDKHRDRTRQQIEAILADTKWSLFRDFTPEGLERYISKLRQAGEGKEKGASAATIGHYIQSIRGFTRWAVHSGRSPIDPLASIKKPNPKSDRRLRRRMILPREWPWLLKSIEGPVYGVSAEHRRLLYEFAIQTALRSDEIRAVKVAHVHLERRVVRVGSEDTKDIEVAFQHFTPGLAELLGKFIEGRTGTEPLFELCSPTNMARMLRKDFVHARKLWIESHEEGKAREACERSDFLAVENHVGESIDFHSLRHTCGAWLAIQGVHPKTIQAIMRHSTITLTLDTYGHLMPGAEPEAIAKLDSLFGHGTGQ